MADPVTLFPVFSPNKQSSLCWHFVEVCVAYTIVTTIASSSNYKHLSGGWYKWPDLAFTGHARTFRSCEILTKAVQSRLQK